VNKPSKGVDTSTTCSTSLFPKHPDNVALNISRVNKIADELRCPIMSRGGLLHMILTLECGLCDIERFKTILWIVWGVFKSRVTMSSTWT
jgi:hypothetical protein